MSKITKDNLKKDENALAIQNKLMNQNFDSPKKKIDNLFNAPKTGIKSNSQSQSNSKYGFSPNMNSIKNELSLSPLLKAKDESIFSLTPMTLDDKQPDKLKIKIKTANKSKAGNNGGQPKTNQDSSLCKLSGLKKDGFNLFSVMDGHGSHGHFISNSVKTLFQDFILKSSHYENTGQLSSFIKKVRDKDYDLLKRCFQFCETSLAKSKYEVNFSGTTAVLVLQFDDLLICANTGDSRAILCSSDGIKPLSIDHKPEVEAEKQRIVSNGGRVEKFNDGGEYVGPYRVWLKYEDYPGLAMSRSLGDFVSKSVGCSCIPEIIEERISSTSQFLVVASDGVWEFLDNEAVYKIVEPYYKKQDPEGASHKLIDEAAKLWKQVSKIF